MMKKAMRLSSLTVTSLLVIWAMVPIVVATAAEGLRYSCSAQIYEALLETAFHNGFPLTGKAL